jgi:hypothetical protein
MAPSGPTIKVDSQRIMKKMRESIKSVQMKRLRKKLGDALAGHEGVWGDSSVPLTLIGQFARVDRHGDGYWGTRKVEVQLGDACWVVKREWHMCVLGMEYGREKKPALVKDDEMVVRMAKRWLLQGLR